MRRALRIVLIVAAFTVLIPLNVSAQEDDGENAMPIGLWEDCDTPQNLPEVVTLGAPLGLTGPISIYGIPQQQGIEIALDEINSSGYLGDDVVMEVLYEDTEGDPQQTIAAMTKLIEEDGVVAIFGPSLSTEAFAADPIAQENEIPVMGVTTSASGITEMGDYVFRGNLPEKVLIPVMIEQVQDLFGIERVAVLYGDDDDFTISGYDVFVETLLASDIEIIGEATFARQDVDFNPQLTNLLSEDPDALVVSALAAEGILIMVQARELGFEGLILGGNGFNTPDVVEQAGDAAENLIVGASWNINSDNELSERFVRTFEERYNFSPDQFSVQAYTVIWLYATAIRCADSVNGSDIRDALYAIEDFNSPVGPIEFDELGEPLHPPIVQIVRDSEFRILTPEVAQQVIGE